jgi:putative two-component system response regulator
VRNLVRALYDYLPDDMRHHASLTNLEYAAIFHDIGKLGVPEAVLNKKEAFTKEDWDIVRQHPRIGVEILDSVDSFKEIEEWILCHHERIDGTGYPDSLCGSSIPLHARVVSIADVYDALTADRCYRPAFSHEEAMEMIKTGKCGAFDPILVRCLENVAPQLLKLKENKLYGDTAFELGDLNLTSDITIPNEMSAAARHAEANRDQLRFLIENTNGYCIRYQDAPPLLTLSARAARRIGCPESVEDPLSSNKLSPFVRTVLLPQVINATKQRDSAEQEFTMEIIDPKSERPVNLKCRTLAVDKGQKYHGFIAIAERITDHK